MLAAFQAPELCERLQSCATVVPQCPGRDSSSSVAATSVGAATTTVSMYRGVDHVEGEATLLARSRAIEHNRLPDKFGGVNSHPFRRSNLELWTKPQL